VCKNPSAATPLLVMGQSTGLDVQASDPDGDPLTYSWAQTAPASPQGPLSSPTVATPTWTAPTVTQATQFTLSVTVSDGKGGPASCAVTVTATASATVSFMTDVEPLLVKACAGCHTSANPQTFALDTGKAYASLVNVPALHPACAGLLRVKPGDPDHSELTGSMTASTCLPDEMPKGGPYLGTDQVDLVRAWISQGAANN
jgi:hypothetical protein